MFGLEVLSGERQKPEVLKFDVTYKNGKGIEVTQRWAGENASDVRRKWQALHGSDEGATLLAVHELSGRYFRR